MVRVVTQGRYRIYVYQESGAPHHEPHCHVYWPDGECAVSLRTFAVLRGPVDRDAVQAHAGQIWATWNCLNP
jgi:hypothetical protein